jgi:outer membrane protein assembly factor BamB
VDNRRSSAAEFSSARIPGSYTRSTPRRDASTGRSGERGRADGHHDRHRVTAHRFLAYFGDVGNIYALNAETGAAVWSDRQPARDRARHSGPTLVAGRLYVPLSSLEESGAGNPNYPCCTFRGGVISYDALNGRRLWTASTIPEEPVQLKKTSRGTQLWGPAGAGVWSSPTVDLKRRAVYVATGNAYTQPAPTHPTRSSHSISTPAYAAGSDK